MLQVVALQALGDGDAARITRLEARMLHHPGDKAVLRFSKVACAERNAADLSGRAVIPADVEHAVAGVEPVIAVLEEAFAALHGSWLCRAMYSAM
ncbi:hypothetical protein [Geminicoccus flavidas]|uniref:hypothetical protein n=1 Tax=Geminicoccus flavidas TaxID=2506407 RepID=UPI001F40668B|nr:hypothetical protein [Geminicoccus flavidas]